MQFFVESWAAWANGLEEDDLVLWAQDKLPMPELCHEWPVPEMVPKAQRRRLSHMAKMVFSQLGQLSDIESLPSVFSSRHGDLPKTKLLLNDLAEEEPLSPTHFALSVHNAISGQFGIMSGNTSPSTLVSAGIDSFHYGLTEALVRMSAGEADSILLVHADMPLPSPYDTFSDEQQIAHCLALKLTTEPKGPAYSLRHKTANQQLTDQLPLPQALSCIKHLINDSKEFVVGTNTQWTWHRHEY